MQRKNDVCADILMKVGNQQEKWAPGLTPQVVIFWMIIPGRGGGGLPYITDRDAHRKFQK